MNAWEGLSEVIREAGNTYVRFMELFVPPEWVAPLTVGILVVSVLGFWFGPRARRNR